MTIASDLRHAFAASILASALIVAGSDDARSQPRAGESAAGANSRLSPVQREALIALLQRQLARCFVFRSDMSSATVRSVVEISLNVDGSLAGDPRIKRNGAHPDDQAFGQAALRAVRRCAPYGIPAQYAPYHNDWKAIDVTFDSSRV